MSISKEHLKTLSDDEIIEKINKCHIMIDHYKNNDYISMVDSAEEVLRVLKEEQETRFNEQLAQLEEQKKKRKKNTRRKKGASEPPSEEDKPYMTEEGHINLGDIEDIDVLISKLERGKK